MQEKILLYQCRIRNAPTNIHEKDSNPMQGPRVTVPQRFCSFRPFLRKICFWPIGLRSATKPISWNEIHHIILQKFDNCEGRLKMFNLHFKSCATLICDKKVLRQDFEMSISLHASTLIYMFKNTKQMII